MKKHLSTILFILIFSIGLSLLLYPTFADWWNSFHQSQAIVDYEAALAKMEPEDYAHLFAVAEEYNRQLTEIASPLTCYDEVEGYEEVLNVSGTGVMGYIQIPKIDVSLPIYHGTSEGVLQLAVGHIEGTSLPTGGGNTHCVLAAHRGLPSSRLFTDLDEMESGDIFTIIVLDRALTYEVDQIFVVEPEEVEKLCVVEDEDLCTLLTCTPYGINSHRLLVRGHRIENTEEVEAVRVTAEDAQMHPLIVVAVAAVLVLLVLVILLLVMKRKNRRKKLEWKE